MSAKDAHTRIINKPVSGVVYTPPPKQSPANDPPLPHYTPIPRPQPKPQRKPVNPLWLIPTWGVLILAIVVGSGAWSPFTSPAVNSSISGMPPIDRPIAKSAATALTIAVATTNTPIPVVETAPVGVLVDDSLPWYILKRHISDASFDAFNGALIELKIVPYQDLDIRSGADNKLCKIRTIYGSALVELFVPCWELGKGGA